MKSNENKKSVLRLFGAFAVSLPLACTHLSSKSPDPVEPPTAVDPAPLEYFIAEEKIPPIIEPENPILPSAHSESLFSISLHDIPVKEFLQALALDAGIDLLLNDGLVGQLSLQMHNKTLSEILTAVARQLPLRYELKGKVLQVFPDIAYLKTYVVDYLNMQRTTGSDIDLSTQIGSISLDSESKSSAGNNSSATVTNISVNDFWLTLEKNLQMMVIQDSQSNEESVFVNREAGFVSVTAKHHTHTQIARYIEEVVSSAQRQVLIEALVIELVLNDKFQAGVDWRILSENGESGNYVQNFTGGPSVTPSNLFDISAPNAVFSVFKNSGAGNSISATLNLLRDFGEVKILSSPKINALNNQSAVLKVVDNRVYFALDVKKVTEDKVETLTTTSEIKTVPIGLVMNVLPYISKGKDIILNIRPTISRILGYATDPNPNLAVAGVQNLVPEIQMREMESVLRVSSGGLVVMGGLMQDQLIEREVSIPGLSKLPAFGSLFRYKTKVKSKTELLVLLRPSIIDSQASYGNHFKAYLH